MKYFWDYFLDDNNQDWRLNMCSCLLFLLSIYHHPVWLTLQVLLHIVLRLFVHFHQNAIFNFHISLKCLNSRNSEAIIHLVKVSKCFEYFNVASPLLYSILCCLGHLIKIGFMSFMESNFVEFSSSDSIYYS